MLAGGATQGFGEARQRGDNTHIAGGGLGDDGGDVLTVRGKGGLNGVDVVVGQHNCLSRRTRRHPGGVG